MPNLDDLLQTIEDIHAAGLDTELWPKALASVARTVGGTAASLEWIDSRSLRPISFVAHGLRPAHETSYLEHYVTLNPRLPAAVQDALGIIGYDYRFLDEQAMDRDPFYMEYLASQDLRYYIAGIVGHSPTHFVGAAVHRSPKQGHVDRDGVDAMRRLVPHLRGAVDVAQRLGQSATRSHLERALDLLSDGVTLLRGDGAIVFINTAFQAMLRSGDGVRVKKGAIAFEAPAARTRLAAALSSTRQSREGGPRNASADFSAARPSGAPPYLASVRPLPRKHRQGQADVAADAMLFVRDPLRRNALTLRMLRDVFGLTLAEAALAQALQAGHTMGDYARARKVSLNTLYTHLRRIKEKTGCTRMAQLIHKLNDLHLPLEPG